MFISYNFAYFLFLTTLGVFTKNIFVKDLCTIQYDDQKVIQDLNKSRQLVFKNIKAFLQTLLILDVYFLMFGSNNRIFASLIYIPLGTVIMFNLNSLMSSHGLNYLESCSESQTKAEITTQNPIFLFLCDNRLMNRFRNVLFVMTFFFGINEYIVFSFIMIPFLMKMVNQINMDESHIRDIINMKNYDHVTTFLYETYEKNEGSILRLYKLVQRYGAPLTSTYGRLYVRIFGKPIPLSGDDTYDTITELETMSPADLVQEDTINRPFDSSEEAPQVSENATSEDTPTTEPEPESEPELEHDQPSISENN
jgi:hypothetical protein